MSQKDFDWDYRVPVRNLCDWDLHFSRLDQPGDIKVLRKGIIKLPRIEIQAQIYNGNKFFTGVDGKGNHAKLYIEDKETRVAFEFEAEDESEKQQVLDRETVKKLIDLKTITAFKKQVKETVLTQSEKFSFVSEAKALGLKDYDKIKFIQDYTGISFDTV